MVSISGAIAVK